MQLPNTSVRHNDNVYYFDSEANAIVVYEKKYIGVSECPDIVINGILRMLSKKITEQKEVKNVL